MATHTKISTNQLRLERRKQARSAGRPRTVRQPRRLTIYIEADLFDDLCRIAGYLAWTEGRRVTLSQALSEALAASPLMASAKSHRKRERKG